MDERVRRHASILVDWSARVEAGDNVVVSVGEAAHELAVAVAEQLGERGANMTTLYDSAEVGRAYLRASEGEFPAHQPIDLALMEQADVFLRLAGGRNTTAAADVPSEIRRRYTRTRQEVREARMATDWVSTVHPTRSLAQQAGMAFEEYQDFVYGAILRDWASLAAEMERMKEVLDAGSEVRLHKAAADTPETDLRLSIEGRTAVNSAASVAYDSHNLPSGEVFTAPYATDGIVHFDVPMTINAKRLRGVTLEFADGEVVEWEAREHEAELSSILETDDGARRLGELGIGMNRAIDRFTENMLFDEKMGDTVHLALGRSYEANLPAGEAGNESAVHVDLITDMSENSRLLVDGEVVQQNGVFRWEEGFEGGSPAES